MLRLTLLPLLALVAVSHGAPASSVLCPDAFGCVNPVWSQIITNSLHGHCNDVYPVFTEYIYDMLTDQFPLSHFVVTQVMHQGNMASQGATCLTGPDATYGHIQVEDVDLTKAEKADKKKLVGRVTAEEVRNGNFHPEVCQSPQLYNAIEQIVRSNAVQDRPGHWTFNTATVASLLRAQVPVAEQWSVVVAVDWLHVEWQLTDSVNYCLFINQPTPDLPVSFVAQITKFV